MSRGNGALESSVVPDSWPAGTASRTVSTRFGLGPNGSEHTLEEVGQHFAVTRERIRQIEAKALRKLRHPSRSRKLKAFLESGRP